MVTLKSPLKVTLWVAEQCNLSCKYCYTAPFSGKLMDTERAFELLDELARLEVIQVIFGGGEPFLHPQLLAMVERAVERGLHAGIISNGILIDDAAQDELVKKFARNKTFLLQISLDSHDPHINDKTRGKGSIVLANLKAIASRGVAVQVATVLTRHNLDTAHLVIEQLYPAVKRFNFVNIRPTRQALKNPELLPNKKESLKFWCNLNEYAQTFPPDLYLPSLKIIKKVEMDDCTEGGIDHKEASFNHTVCSAGVTFAHIDSHFNVLGCGVAKDFSKMGNIAHCSFEEAWTSEQAEKVRNALVPLCRKIIAP